VIGGGWAARFLLNGWDVQVFDPDPQAERKIAAVMANARLALPALSDVPMPPEGKLTFHGTIGEAVEGAEYVQESVSERIELKHKVYAQLQQSNPGVLIGSSTSGFKASDLQKSALRRKTSSSRIRSTRSTCCRCPRFRGQRRTRPRRWKRPCRS
jgi:carnitine 3-dehydrogenase